MSELKNGTYSYSIDELRNICESDFNKYKMSIAITATFAYSDDVTDNQMHDLFKRHEISTTKFCRYINEHVISRYTKKNVVTCTDVSIESDEVKEVDVLTISTIENMTVQEFLDIIARLYDCYDYVYYCEEFLIDEVKICRAE